MRIMITLIKGKLETLPIELAALRKRSFPYALFLGVFKVTAPTSSSEY